MLMIITDIDRRPLGHYDFNGTRWRVERMDFVNMDPFDVKIVSLGKPELFSLPSDQWGTIDVDVDTVDPGMIIRFQPGQFRLRLGCQPFPKIRPFVIPNGDHP